MKDVFQESGQIGVFNDRMDYKNFLYNLTISRAREYLKL